MEEELRNLIAKAEGGDVEAMCMVGDCYNRGYYIEKDDAMAQMYYKLAADKGHPVAAFMVSLGYLNGVGVKKSKSDALKYMQFAADNGVANAQFVLGNLYRIGEIGVFFKEQKAVHYLEMAAKQGQAKAQIILGEMNLTNDGAKYTLEKGLFWLLCAYLHGEAAQKESEEAMNRLNSLLQAEVPGGRDRFDEMIESIKAEHPTYITNP